MQRRDGWHCLLMGKPPRVREAGASCRGMLRLLTRLSGWFQAYAIPHGYPELLWGSCWEATAL